MFFLSNNNWGQPTKEHEIMWHRSDLIVNQCWFLGCVHFLCDITGGKVFDNVLILFTNNHVLNFKDSFEEENKQTKKMVVLHMNIDQSYINVNSDVLSF